MTTVAVVPIKYLEDAKSRLAGCLALQARRCLVLTLLRHVLKTLHASTSIHKIIVVTPDPTVLHEVESLSISGILQTETGLNAAIRLGRDIALQYGARTMVVLLPDLPLLTVADVDTLIEASSEASVVLAPDRHHAGTNAMVLRPPGAIDPAFGVNSLHAHRSRAHERGLSLREHHSIGTSFDLDTETDLEELRHLPGNGIGCLER